MLSSTKLSQLNELIAIENSNKNSLKALATYLYSVDFSGESSIKVNEKSGSFYIKDWSKKISDLADGRNFQGLIYINTLNLPKSDIFAEKLRLYNIGTGLSFCPTQNNIATIAAKRTAEKKANEKEKATVKDVIFDSWETTNGREIVKHFAKKTGIDSPIFLEKYGVLPIAKVQYSNGKVYTVRAENFCFSLIAKDWTKKREPKNPNKDFRKPITLIAGKKPYIFGLPQLPPTGENLLIFEGETDTLCAAWHGQNAICLGGAKNLMPDEIAADLKKRFKSIFVVYDNDETGKTQGEILAQKHGFIYVDIELSLSAFSAQIESKPQIKDLCDIYNLAVKIETRAFLTNTFLGICTGLNTLINAPKSDRFSVSIFHAINVPFRQYISEKGANGQPYIHCGMYNPVQILALSIAKNKRVCLQAAAGAGKSTALIDLINAEFFSPDSQSNKLYFEQNGINRVVIAVPTITLAEQLFNNFVANGMPNAQLITGEKNAAEKIGSLIEDVIICTYDSVLIARISENTLLVVDEAHQIITEKGYRDKATKSIMQAIKSTAYTLLLSATPNYLFNEYFGFKLVAAVADITNTKHIKICEYTGKETELMPAIIDKFAANKNAQRGTILIKLDNSTQLRAGALYAQKLGLTSEVFSGQNDKFRRDNENYNSILKTSRLATKVDIIFTTCLIEAGVSIKDKINTIYICDTINYAKIIQQLARPRFDAQTGINAIVNAVIFIQKDKANEKKKVAFSSDYTAQIMLKNKVELAQTKADYLNENKNDNQNTILAADAKDYTFEDADGLHYVDDIAILFDILILSNTKDVSLLSERLKHTDKTIKSITITTLETSENADFIDCINAIKDEKSTAQSVAINTLINTISNDKDAANYLLFNLIATEKNPIKKASLYKLLNVPTDKQDAKDARKFYQTLPNQTNNILINKDANILGFLSKVADYMKLPKNTIFDAIAKAEKADALDDKILLEQIEYAERKTREKAYKAGKAGEKDINQCETQIEIYRVFSKSNDNIKQNNRQPYLLSELLKIVNNALTNKAKSRAFKPKTETGKDGVIKYLKTFFDITPVRTSKASGEKTRYILDRKKQPKTKAEIIAEKEKAKADAKAEKEKAKADAKAEKAAQKLSKK